MQTVKLVFFFSFFFFFFFLLYVVQSGGWSRAASRTSRRREAVGRGSSGESLGGRSATSHCVWRSRSDSVLSPTRPIDRICPPRTNQSENNKTIANKHYYQCKHLGHLLGTLVVTVRVFHSLPKTRQITPAPVQQSTHFAMRV